MGENADETYTIQCFSWTKSCKEGFSVSKLFFHNVHNLFYIGIKAIKLKVAAKKI